MSHLPAKKAFHSGLCLHVKRFLNTSRRPACVNGSTVDISRILAKKALSKYIVQTFTYDVIPSQSTAGILPPAVFLQNILQNS